MRLIGKGAMLLLATWATGAGAEGQAQGSYRLGPEDHLMVKVYDFRQGSGDAHAWTALNGEFVVGPDGTVSLPLIGEVKAAGGTTADLADEIGDSLKTNMGLVQRPDASVQIVKYRPYYVTGAVQRPGQYEFHPKLTVLQAVSTAEGVVRATGSDLLAYQRDALTGRGDLRVLDAERLAQRVRQARLASEIAGAPAVVFPADVLRRASDPGVAQAMREEVLLFEARRNRLESQVKAIDQSKAVLNGEIDSLGQKGTSLDHQLDMSRKQLTDINGLVANGSEVRSRQLGAEQTVAAFESSRLDVQVATSKARQELSQADRDVIDLRTKFQTEALSEATDVRGRLDALNERLSTAQGLIDQAEVNAPSAVRSDEEVQPVYQLVRTVDGKSVTSDVTEGDPVQPGDVVKVTLPKVKGTVRPLPALTTFDALAPVMPGGIVPQQGTSLPRPQAAAPATSPQAVAQPQPTATVAATSPAAVNPAQPTAPAPQANADTAALPANVADARAASRLTVPDAPASKAAGRRTRRAAQRRADGREASDDDAAPSPALPAKAGRRPRGGAQDDQP